jgi:endonuclease-8
MKPCSVQESTRKAWLVKGELSKHFEAYEQNMCPRDHIPFHKADLGKTKRHTYFCNKCEVLYE